MGRKEEQGALQLMEWPPQSPDLNIIEQVWDHLDREKVQKQPKSVEELWKVLKNAWHTIPADVFQTEKQHSETNTVCIEKQGRPY